MVDIIQFGPATRFLKEQLIYYSDQLEPEPEIDLWGYDGRFHNASADLPYGIDSWQKYGISYVGEGVDFSGQVTEIPLANFSVAGRSITACFGILGTKWTWAELEKARTAAMVGQVGPTIDIVGSYYYALIRGLKIWLHKKTLFGKPEMNFAGLLTNPYVHVEEVAKNDGPFADNATPDDVYEFFNGKASEIREGTFLTPRGALLSLISEKLNKKLNMRYGDGTGLTIKQVLRGTDLGDAQVGSFNVINEMSGKNFRQLSGLTEVDGLNQGADGSLTINDVQINDTDELAILYPNAAGVATKHYYPIQTIDPERQLLEYRQVGVCGVSEVDFSQPAYVRLLVFRNA